MRILGVTLPDNKRMEIALTALYGVGRPRAQYILKGAGVDFGKKAPAVTEAEETAIRKIVEKMQIEGDLKRTVASNIKRLKDIKCYRGSRHSKGLPVRGQRTKTNSRTRRGNVRKTMGTGRRRAKKVSFVNKKFERGVLHIQSTYNNTMLTLADEGGNAVFFSSSGALGFKGAKKGTPFAAAKVGETLGEKAKA